MTHSTTITVSARSTSGKKVKNLRTQSLVPANITTPDGESVMVQIPQQVFIKMHHKVGDTGLVYLTVEGEKQVRPVLIDDIQYHSIKNQILHVVFKQVNLKEKITAEVPVKLVGESKIPNTVIITVHDSIEIEALPAELPDQFEVDISNLTEIGQMITFKDLVFDRSKITLQINEEELDTPIVMLQEVKEEPVEVEAAPAEGAEGAEPAADAAPAADKPAA